MLCRSVPVLSQLRRRPDRPPDRCMPCIPADRFSADTARAARRPGLVRTRGRSMLPDRPAPSHRGCHGGGDRMRAARRRAKDWPGAVVSRAARGSGRCISSGVLPQGSRCPLLGTGLAEPVRYLLRTGDAPVVYPPYTCAGNAPDHQAARSACGCCERGTRRADVDLAQGIEAAHPRHRLGSGPRRS